LSLRRRNGFDDRDHGSRQQPGPHGGALTGGHEFAIGNALRVPGWATEETLSSFTRLFVPQRGHGGLARSRTNSSNSLSQLGQRYSNKGMVML
jgi:hypothetical protein